MNQTAVNSNWRPYEILGGGILEHYRSRNNITNCNITCNFIPKKLCYLLR